ncbi:aldo/keto reductase [Nocardiopsis coralliicola]
MPATIPTTTLADGTPLPAVGFGTYRLNGASGADAIASALRTGYRLLDSAFNYGNEGAVGEGLRRSGVPRADVRVTSKLPGRFQSYDKARRTVEESVFRAGLDFIDLYLIHWPNPAQGLYTEAWQALVDAQRDGLIASIGVCNFLPEHLERITEATGVAPVVNQVELHPYFPQDEQRAWDAEHGICTQSWSPLGRGSAVLEEPALTRIAEQTGRTPGQVVLRWHHQLGAVPIPKAASPERQRQNLDLFDFALDDSQMAAIASLARADGRLKDQDPAVYEEF